MKIYFEKINNTKINFLSSLTLEIEKISRQNNFNFNNSDSKNKKELLMIFSMLAKNKYHFETFEATNIKKEDISFPDEYPMYPLLFTNSMCIALKQNPKGYEALSESFFFEKKINEYITLNYKISKSSSEISLNLNNTNKKFMITCFKDKITIPHDYYYKKNNSILSKINENMIPKNVFEEYDYIKKTFVDIENISKKLQPLAIKILFENHSYTKEELETIELTEDISVTNSGFFNLLTEINKNKIFINLNNLEELKKNLTFLQKNKKNNAFF